MSQFRAGIDERIAELRAALAKAREAQDEFLEDNLITELESLIELAGRNDIDTGQMKQVLAAETGAIPIIADPEDS